MASTNRSTLRTNRSVPGDGLDAARMPGHWLPARPGKRVLRPGGVEPAQWMLDSMDLGPQDRVMEPTAGLGATARWSPAACTPSAGAAAVAALSVLGAVGAIQVRAIRSDAAGTGLPDCRTGPPSCP